MQLLRVRVPNFRALKDVDITFEKDFVPQIFPLGSLNGGGKSTLLQLIFILLHGWSRAPYIDVILEHVAIDKFGEIATFDIWDGERVVSLKFIYHTVKSFDVLGVTSIPQYLRDNQLIQLAQRNHFFDQNETKMLFCQSSFPGFLNRLTPNVFLAAPSSQVYFFLPPEERMSLFNVDGNYNDALDRAKKSLPGFFTYDAFSVAEIAKFFRTARDMDFDEKVKTGHYGNHYDRMLPNINKIVAGKKVVPQLADVSQRIHAPDKDLIDSIIFKTNDGAEIYPEDLSHGELKKLSIYAWLKANQIKDSIVLMDEIENGFHPDWQFQIVKELEAWEPSNQYILATHSYELCTALTPSHVKELEPKLLSTPK
jgi:energy-coupling factor transporter ATP-binding protein EcfA2